MNITLTSLEALILKATHESLPKPDAPALEAFYVIMRDSPDGPQLAAQALAARIHSHNSKEAILALLMLDQCMRRCDANFHAEIGKFRFLNELIKLVSPKYLADQTSPVVRQMVLQLLRAWSLEYVKETKFKVAFDMLKSQGVVKEPLSPLPTEDTIPAIKPRKTAIYEDEEKSKLLQKLLQSKKPEDLQHANRLIKTMVREDEHRTEVNSRRSQEVLAAFDCAELLKDLLKNSADASADEEQLIHELYGSCMRIRPILQDLASTDVVECLGDIIYASEVIDEVVNSYETFRAEKNKQKDAKEGETTSNTDRLLDFAGADVPSLSKVTAIDDLGDIFSNETAANIAEPLKPVNLMNNEDVELLDDRNKKEGWNDLDSLGEQMLKQSLPENAKRLDNFNNKKAKKIPMNAIEKTSVKSEVNNAAASLLDFDFFTNKTEEKVSTPAHSPGSANDDAMVDISTDLTNGSQNNLNDNTHSPPHNILDLRVPLENNAKNNQTKVDNKDIERDRNKSEVKPLTDIHVTLDSVQPSKVPPLTAYEEPDGVTVVLHFCKDKPRPDVNVVVISTTSKNTSPITDYKFQGLVPKVKGCKVRLLSPSGASLPAYNPFLPPPALTQLMLLARPAALQQLVLKFVITYTCDDDTVSEIGEVNLPLHTI